MHRRHLILSGLAATAGASGLAGCASQPRQQTGPNYPIAADRTAPAYTFDELVAAGSRELGVAAEAIGGVIERIFATRATARPPTSPGRRAPGRPCSACATAAARCT